MKHFASKLLSLTMALMLVLSASAFAEIPDYLHVGSTPLVDSPVTLKIALELNDETTDPYDTWTYEYVTKILGVNVELEYFYDSTRNERISLIMASAELPDMIMACNLSTSELSKYGASEGLLLDLAPYLTEENAPNLTKLMAENDNVRNAVTMTDGRVFSLPYVMVEPKGSQTVREYYNFDWLEELGLAVPTTLDEFVDMLRAFKAKDENIIPLGGNYARYNPTYLIFNALGYNFTGDYHLRSGYETMIGLRNGEIVMPCYDREVYTKYLEVMHQIYSEGLMEQDFFTLDKDTVTAHLVAGLYGVFSDVPSVFGGIEFGQQWFGGIPLTSEYNDTPFWPNYTGVTPGAIVISADTKYPELCVAFADHLYGEKSSDYFAACWGPSVNETDLLLGKTSGWFFDASIGDRNYQDYIDHADEYDNSLFYLYRNIPMWRPHRVGIQYDYVGTMPDENGNDIVLCEYPEGDDIMELAKSRKTANNINDQYKLAQILGWGKYLTDEFVPTVFYFDEDTTLRVEELQTLISEYASLESAKFIIGTRDLSEVDKFFDELEKLGADEYVQYYADYYAATKN